MPVGQQLSQHSAEFQVVGAVQWKAHPEKSVLWNSLLRRLTVGEQRVAMS